tara:strand:+ start:203 stop:769 length:567 start_codon:yes stop_codon:yes gene_type:complete
MPRQKVDEQTIIKEALKLFRQKSYHATSMADIAMACGLLKGSLYHYFHSKEDLMIKVIESVHVFFAETVFTIAYNHSLDAVDRMDLIFKEAEKIFVDQESGEILGNVGVETALSMPEFQPTIQAFFSDYFKAIKEVYRSKFDEGMANELAERSVSEIQGALTLSRIFNDEKFIKNTHLRTVARLRNNA